MRIYALGPDGLESDAGVDKDTSSLGCECECGFYAEHRILCRHALAVLIYARVGQTDLEPLVAPFCTTEGWRAVYETLMPLHALPAVSELGVDEDELLPKLRGSGSGRKKMKRWAEGKVASQASQVDRFQF